MNLATLSRDCWHKTRTTRAPVRSRLKPGGGKWEAPGVWE
jgi:hypothetical protein